VTHSQVDDAIATSYAYIIRSY